MLAWGRWAGDVGHDMVGIAIRPRGAVRMSAMHCGIRVGRVRLRNHDEDSGIDPLQGIASPAAWARARATGTRT